MSPRPKSDDPRAEQYRLRMTQEELEKLNFCSEKLGLKKSDVLRAGLDIMYEKAKSIDK